MILPVEETVYALRSWPQAERAWWRQLLEKAPAEALLVAALAVELAAEPVDPDTLLPAGGSRHQPAPRLAPGLRRAAPAAAHGLLDRMRRAAA